MYGVTRTVGTGRQQMDGVLYFESSFKRSALHRNWSAVLKSRFTIYPFASISMAFVGAWTY